MEKLTSVAAAFVVLFSLFLGTGALAQQGMTWRGGGGWGPGTPYTRMYNPQTVETVSGEVVSVENVTPMQGMAAGVHVMMKTGQETHFRAPRAELVY